MNDYFLHSLGHRMTGLVLESHLAIPGCSLQVPQHRHFNLEYKNGHILPTGQWYAPSADNKHA